MANTTKWNWEDTVDVSYDPNAQGQGGAGGGVGDSVVFGPPGGQPQQGEGQTPNLFDDHDGLSEKQLDDLLEDMNDLLSDEEKSDVQEMIEEHCQEDDGGPDNTEGKEQADGDGSGKGGKEAGKGAGGIWTFANVDVSKVKKKRKWETVIKDWVLKKLKVEHRDTEQWSRINPRFADVMATGDIIIPTEMEVEDQYWDEEQIEVWFYQDTSGSCTHLADRFFKAAASLPPDKFKIRMFCFDTKVYETDLESKKLYGFGGTAFDILEAEIQKRMKSEEIKYPEAVFVVTDGYGNSIQPEKPERWYWFLSDDYRHCIPDECHKHMLKDYE